MNRESAVDHVLNRFYENVRIRKSRCRLIFVFVFIAIALITAMLLFYSAKLVTLGMERGGTPLKVYLNVFAYVGIYIPAMWFLGWVIYREFAVAKLTSDEETDLNILTREIRNYRDQHHRGYALLRHGCHEEAIDDLCESLTCFENEMAECRNSGEWKNWQDHYMRILLDRYYRYRSRRRDCLKKLGRFEEARIDDIKLNEIKNVIDQDVLKNDPLSVIVNHTESANGYC